MALDPQNIERLKQIGRKLPKHITLKTAESSDKRALNNKLHRVEIEEDPNELFHELIKISPDGNVPEHLIERLRDIEIFNSKSNKMLGKNNNSTGTTEETNSRKPQEKHHLQNQDLYTDFQKLLLEEEEE